MLLWDLVSEVSSSLGSTPLAAPDAGPIHRALACPRCCPHALTPPPPPHRTPRTHQEPGEGERWEDALNQLCYSPSPS